MDAQAPVYHFGPFRFDPVRRDLTRDGAPVAAAGGRALALLAGLLERPGELVTKDELYDKAWPGLLVEESNLSAQMRSLRVLLDDAARPHRWIATVPGRGYRFTGALDSHPEANRTPAASPHGELIGRDTELAALHATCARHRLVTLTGAGGIGKTRLALDFAAEFTADTGNSLVFLALEAVRQPAQVAERLGARLGLSGVPAAELGPRITAILRSRPQFLLLDNCEHVLAAVAQLAATIMEGVPGVSILATSRAPLGLAAEMVVPLGALEVPARDAPATAAAIAQYPAVRLLLQDAAASGADFVLDESRAAEIAKICRRLDGIPLALKLAAPLLARMTPAELNAALAAAWRLEAAPSTGLPARQRTVEAAIAWSVALLDAPERVLLLHLGVFAGSFATEAVGAVAPGAVADHAVPRLLASLIDKSLVVAEPPQFNIRRYRLLDSTRSFARRQLGLADMAAARLRLLHHLCGFYKQANIDYKTMGTLPWLGRYAPDLDNIRELLPWALYETRSHSGTVQAAQCLVCEIETLTYETQYGGDWHAILERCVQLIDSSTPRGLRVRLCMAKAGGTNIGSTKVTEISRDLVAWHREAGNEVELGCALVALGMALFDPASPAFAFACLREAEELLRRQNHLRCLATCLGTQAFFRGMTGDVAGAETLTREALSIAESIDCRRVSTEARSYLIALTYEAGRTEEAIAAARVQILRCREAMQPVAELYTSYRLMAYLLHSGQTSQALEVLPAVFSCYTGPHSYMTSIALHAGLLAAAHGRLETAARLAFYAQAYNDELGLFTDEALDEISRTRTNALLTATLPPERLAALAAESAKWDEKAVLDLLHGLCPTVAQNEKTCQMDEHIIAL
jgi:predicted ATPase/DNA-binding winged helix-turn-helix (wHTH) protein